MGREFLGVEEVFDLRSGEVEKNGWLLGDGMNEIVCE